MCFRPRNPRQRQLGMRNRGTEMTFKLPSLSNFNFIIPPTAKGREGNWLFLNNLVQIVTMLFTGVIIHCPFLVFTALVCLSPENFSALPSPGLGKPANPHNWFANKIRF